MWLIISDVFDPERSGRTFWYFFTELERVPVKIGVIYFIET